MYRWWNWGTGKEQDHVANPGFEPGILAPDTMCSTPASPAGHTAGVVGVTGTEYTWSQRPDGWQSTWGKKTHAWKVTWEKWNVIHPHRGILLSNKNKLSEHTTHKNGPQRCHAGWKKKNRPKSSIYYMVPYIWNSRKCKQTYSDRKQARGCLRTGDGGQGMY